MMDNYCNSFFDCIPFFRIKKETIDTVFRLNSFDFVMYLYLLILKRDCDLPSLTHWCRQLDESSLTRQEILAMILGSDEAQQYGVTVEGFEFIFNGNSSNTKYICDNLQSFWLDDLLPNRPVNSLEYVKTIYPRILYRNIDHKCADGLPNEIWDIDDCLSFCLELFCSEEAKQKKIKLLGIETMYPLVYFRDINFFFDFIKKQMDISNISSSTKSDRLFVFFAYLSTLKRNPDIIGFINYLSKIRLGELDKSKLMAILLNSCESKSGRSDTV